MSTASKPSIKDALKGDGAKITMIGGQAVMEGVMMRGRHLYVMAVRKPDHGIEVISGRLTPIAEKYPILGWPIIRGVVSFVDSLVMGMKIITQSAEVAVDGIEEESAEEEPSKFETFLRGKFGDKLDDYMMYLTICIALVFAVGLFVLVPLGIGHLFNPLLHGNTWGLSFIEGISRIAIFLLYVWIVSLSKDIKRVYRYHGAEHKTINCFEHREDLTVENVRKYSRLHKRCGTSFLLIVMIVAMIVFMFIHTSNVWLRLISRLILLPVVAGLSYEVIRWAGRNDNPLVNLISYPGLCLQKITTADPDDSMIETAITAMKGVLDAEPEER